MCGSPLTRPSNNPLPPVNNPAPVNDLAPVQHLRTKLPGYWPARHRPRGTKDTIDKVNKATHPPAWFIRRALVHHDLILVYDIGDAWTQAPV